MIAGIFLTTTLLLILAYHFYGKRISNYLMDELEDELPSVALRDDMYYLPKSFWELFAEYFTCSASPSIILGVVAAAMVFGWVPALLWLIFGSILVGGVHDLAVICSSLYVDGLPIYEIIHRHTEGKLYKELIALFGILEIVLVICCIDLAGKIMNSNPAVAVFTICLMILSVIIGILTYIFRLKLWLAALIATPFCFYLLIGISTLPDLTNILDVSLQQWQAFTIGFIYLCGILPSWLLTKPLNFSSTMLILIIVVVAAICLITGGLSTQTINLPPINHAVLDNEISYWPLLFTTVVGAAVNGFHGVIGTTLTAKCIKSKSQILPISYGTMLFQAFIGLITICIIMQTNFTENTNVIDSFATGFGYNLSQFGTPIPIAQNIGYALLTLLIINTAAATFTAATTQIKEVTNHKISMAEATAIATFIIVFLIALYSKGEEIRKVLWPVYGSLSLGCAGISMFYVFSIINYFNHIKYNFLRFPIIFLLAISIVSMIIVICITQFMLNKIVASLFLFIILRIFTRIHSSFSFSNLFKF